MTLERWIALILLAICLVYGYTAFFSMDAALPPFMQRNPVWPSTFPKVLSVLGVFSALMVILNVEKNTWTPGEGDINYRQLFEYKIGQTVALLVLMAVYALTLRPAGFIASTVLFLILGAAVLGERNFKVLTPIAITTALIVWWLVQQVLGIFLRPFPFFLGT